MSVVDERFTLLNDMPPEGPDADLLGTGPVAAGLADLVHSSRGNTPFVLAVDGAWGTGKSTLMGQLSVELARRPDVEVVWFNAWTASGVSALTGMLTLVLGRLDRNVVRRSFRRLNSGGLLTGTVRLGLSAVAGFFRVDRAIDELWDRMAVDARAREDARRLVQDAVTSWVDDQHGRPRRTIAVFVDDLDRCDEATTVEIFEVIKLYLDLPGIAFVLGCDLAVLSSMRVPGVEETAQVRHYLEKIVQVTYQIPPPEEAAVRATIRGYAERSGTTDLLTDATTALIGRQTGGNPRRVKRLINSFVTEYRIDPGWRDVGAEALMRAVLLQHLYPECYRAIRAGTGDTVGDLLDYRWIRESRWQRPGDVDLGCPGLAPFLERYGLSPDDPEVLARLDERVPDGWSTLADNADLAALLTDLGGPTDRLRLQQRLRRRPLRTAPAPEAAARVRLDGVRLLWIDDTPVNNEPVLDSLTARGAQIRTAGTGAQALDLLRHFAPNLLVSDVTRDGTEVGFDDLRAIRSAGYTGPALFHSGWVTPERRTLAEAAGANGITSSVDDLIDWVERHATARSRPGSERSGGDPPTWG
ncbi:hypothetical protein AWW66_24935 [Micromonospora rosaria]|uniref:Response regulatory domain-containing protein n=1 Tax=Micromonospora rosaria TaxID=47874 RepID=A0A136PLH0_9ACTN|nr:P-loop NTPase fold protein [Micromonospora rosaria]KXK59320.1 hypothetical protein AWW66_24935 [Micromonospora rosaria]